jgi:hypothetical protein
MRVPELWSSDLHACHVFPLLGFALMRKALSEWPIRFNDRAQRRDKPEITFVIPHRGADRVPLLLATLQTILSQHGVALECIVVEQNTKSELAELPDGVRYIHLPHPTDPSGWYKSWAFNVGVSAARADVVVCHDGDLLVPCDYGREILKFLLNGDFEVVHLQRFLFCLNRGDTERLMDSKSLQHSSAPERVRQSWQGGTLAIKKESFFKIGGYDEDFVGWGGEDNEFYDRCTTLNAWRYGYLPFLHLWHEPQSAKFSQESEHNLRHMYDLLDQPPSQRIARLKTRQSLVRFQNQVSVGDSLHG